MANMYNEYVQQLNSTNAPNQIGRPIAAPSVNSQADNALENSARTRAFAENLLAELRQQDSTAAEPHPCRSGIDGKLTDAAENSSVTLSVLQEIRAYLLG